MQLTIVLGNSYARSAEYYLRKRYNSKAKLEKLIKVSKEHAEKMYNIILEKNQKDYKKWLKRR